MDSSNPEEPNLGHLIYWFNHGAAEYCHPSWHPEALTQLREGRPIRTPLALRVFSQWLIANAGGGEVAGRGDDFDFTQPLSRLALVPTDALMNVISVLGLLSLGLRLKHVLERENVNQIQSIFGREIFTQALRWADYFEPSLNVKWTATIPLDELQLALIKSGYQGLIKALPQQNKAYMSRLSLKFPREISRPPKASIKALVTVPDVVAVQQYAVPIFKSMEPSWANLFL